MESAELVELDPTDQTLTVLGMDPTDVAEEVEEGMEAVVETVAEVA